MVVEKHEFHANNQFFFFIFHSSLTLITPERKALKPINENSTVPYGYCANGAEKRPSPSIKEISSFNKRTKTNDENFHVGGSIQHALTRSPSNIKLIGDMSVPYCLPIIHGRHEDLISINSGTLRSLLLGEFNDRVESFKIIDCRFPYEYDGGHILNAVNIFTQEQVIEELVKIKSNPPCITTSQQKREILIFHCEFSSQRGPRL